MSTFLDVLVAGIGGAAGRGADIIQEEITLLRKHSLAQMRQQSGAPQKLTGIEADALGLIDFMAQNDMMDPETHEVLSSDPSLALRFARNPANRSKMQAVEELLKEQATAGFGTRSVRAADEAQAGVVGDLSTLAAREDLDMSQREALDTVRGLLAEINAGVPTARGIAERQQAEAAGRGQRDADPAKLADRRNRSESFIGDLMGEVLSPIASDSTVREGNVFGRRVYGSVFDEIKEHLSPEEAQTFVQDFITKNPQRMHNLAREFAESNQQGKDVIVSRVRNQILSDAFAQQQPSPEAPPPMLARPEDGAEVGAVVPETVPEPEIGGPSFLFSEEEVQGRNLGGNVARSRTATQTAQRRRGNPFDDARSSVAASATDTDQAIQQLQLRIQDYAQAPMPTKKDSIIKEIMRLNPEIVEYSDAEHVFNQLIDQLLQEQGTQ